MEALKETSDILERAVEDRTKKLQLAMKDLEMFSYTAAHDLRAPLRSIEGYSEMLLRDLGARLDPDSRDRLLRMAKSAEKLDNLISDLLAYAGIGREEIVMEPLDLDAVLNEIVAQPDFTRAHIELRRPLGRVVAHQTMLNQVLTNLLSNAVKFVRPGETPSVEIWSERQGRYRRLWIEDNGIGIDPELISKIFTPFVRAHAAGFPGTGIGLAIVKRAVEKMGGAVGVQSSPGLGSRFWIDLEGA